MFRSIKTRSDHLYFDKAVGRVGSESLRHFHDAVEIYYLMEGKCNYFIGEHFYEVVAGDVIIIPGGTMHRTNYGVRPHSRALVNFPLSALPPSIAELIPSIGHLYRNTGVKRRIDEIFLRIEDEYALGDSLSEDAIICYITELLLIFARSKTEVETKSEEKGPVNRAVEYIKENYSTDIKLSEVSALSNVSAEHLSRAFKKETGFGFNEYLTLTRLKKAEYMLRNEPGRSVGEIAYACGFNDSNYFSFKFKKLYGVSPLSLRKTAK